MIASGAAWSKSWLERATVPDAIAAATGLDLALVQGYAESLASADMWPNDGEPVESKHAAALLVAAMVTPEYVREYGSLPFAEAIWENVLDSAQCKDFYLPGDNRVEWFTERHTFGFVVTGAIKDYCVGEDFWRDKIAAGKISANFADGECFAELEAVLRLGSDLHTHGTYHFRRSEVAPAESGKMVWRAELPLDVLRDLAAALDGQVVRSVKSDDRPAVLLH